MVLNTQTKVVALAGGVGGAKLVYGLSRILTPDQLTIIGNVGDDFDLYGLHISPDLDTVMYTLAGVANTATGWGLTNETWQMLEMLQHYGEEIWFRLGDQDLATHVLRTHWLAQGISLTAVTDRLMRGLNVPFRLLPVTDDPLSTVIDTIEKGTLAFQEYFVRQRWLPTVKRVWFQHADEARMTEPVAAALHEADAIIICPSNPVLSIEPLLVVPGVRQALEKRPGPCVAVSPFVGGKAVKGPAEKLMRELNLDISPRGLAAYYGGLLDGLVIDTLDQDQPQAENTAVLVTQTLMQSQEDKVRLAGDVIDWVGSLTT
jgi:LPPG:FO 2-phospho-L-lactate transferase